MLLKVFRSKQRRTGGARVKFEPIMIRSSEATKYEPVYHGCRKPYCSYCRIMADIEIGDVVELDNDTRRTLLHKLASGEL